MANLKFKRVASLPTTKEQGCVYFCTTNKQLYVAKTSTEVEKYSDYSIIENILTTLDGVEALLASI